MSSLVEPVVEDLDLQLGLVQHPRMIMNFETKQTMFKYLQSDIVQIPANIFDIDIIIECDPASSVESFILGMT